MRSKALGLGVVLLVGAVWFSQRSDTPPRAADSEADAEVVNRFWISKIPQSAKEKIDIFAMIDEPTFGLFQTTSAFEGDFTAFEWKRDDKTGRLRIRMLQTDKGHKLGAKVARDGCGAFDLCMKVKGAPRGAKQYYSMDDWIIEPGSAVTPDALRAQVMDRVAQLP